MNNNDILKKYIREEKSNHPNGFFASFSASEIASASRPTLDEWLGDAGQDSQAIIDAYRATESPGNPAMPASQSRHPQQPAPMNQSDALKALETLQALFASQSAPQPAGLTVEDMDKLKADLKDELRRELGLQPVRVEIVQPDKSVVDVGMQHYLFPDLLTLVSCRLHVFLSGPAGSFKTTAAEQVAKALGLEYSAISVCGQTGAHALLGYQDATGQYITTEFRKRYEQGGIFLLDEIDNGNANVLAVLNSALANGLCAFPDGMIQKHPDFILIASGNTAGHGASASYIGRNPIDGATLDRFAFMQWDYDQNLERAIAGNDQWTREVQNLRQSAATCGSKVIISPRATFGGARLLQAGMSKEKVLSYLVRKGTGEIEWNKIAGNA